MELFALAYPPRSSSEYGGLSQPVPILSTTAQTPPKTLVTTAPKATSSMRSLKRSWMAYDLATHAGRGRQLAAVLDS